MDVGLWHVIWQPRLTNPNLDDDEKNYCAVMSRDFCGAEREGCNVVSTAGRVVSSTRGFAADGDLRLGRLGGGAHLVPPAPLWSWDR